MFLIDLTRLYLMRKDHIPGRKIQVLLMGEQQQKDREKNSGRKESLKWNEAGHRALDDHTQPDHSPLVSSLGAMV